MNSFDVIVIGGGHAGCEAALASSRIGVKTALITPEIKNIALAPCNPSIGGPAKGIVVREIDALGGQMGRTSDQSMIQIKMLNSSKGPAVHSMRAQIDINTYPQNMQEQLLNEDNLTIIEDFAVDIVAQNSEITSIICEKSGEIKCKKLILTTGTYMDSYLIKGDEKISSGPKDTKTSKDLSNSLRKLNIELFRLKTGTPARVKKSSIDFSKADIAPGDDKKLAFSFYEPTYIDFKDQQDCYLIYTNAKTHEVIKNNLHRSAMYSGTIEGVGPRYCPSIEDKLVRFADKERHQLFLEPESLSSDSIYVQGFSTSMPDDVQDQMLRTLPGLENVEVIKYGYAIEYDAVRPEQLKATLELKNIANLYCAGQINGTSGYEEAAGQGIVAGINAALNVLNKEPLILSRLNSYIGLMIDDLITKGTEEPYRLLTSRSEFRLFLRNDNADQRLSEIGYNIGLLKQADYNKYLTKLSLINDCREVLKVTKITPKILTDDYANMIKTEPLKRGYSAFELLKRSTVTSENILEITNIDYPIEIMTQVEIEIKYEGYISKVLKQIERQQKLYKVKIPTDICYNNIDNLALEAREKLTKIKPETLGQAANISGINPADISVLEIYLKMKRG